MRRGRLPTKRRKGEKPNQVNKTNIALPSEQLTKYKQATHSKRAHTHTHRRKDGMEPIFFQRK